MTGADAKGRHGRSPPCHGWRERWCRAALTLGWGLSLVGCAPSQGWQRTDVRACAARSAAIVCVHAQPDRAVTFVVGDQTVVSGECVRAPKADAAGRLAVVVHGEGEPVRHRVRVARSAMTVVTLDGEGDLDVAQRHACDGAVPPPPATD